jgi:ADP-heptose:LPS heptosyltransferase
MGGAGEADLTGRVAAAASGALDLGGRTDLVDLAALLSLCDLVVTNDTGPMHLAGAVGTPTVSLWGPSDPREVRQVGAPDVRVTGPGLPCKPCYRNDCARRGPGTLLADAHEECMRLIEVDDVMRAVEAALARGGAGV